VQRYSDAQALVLAALGKPLFTLNLFATCSLLPRSMVSRTCRFGKYASTLIYGSCGRDVGYTRLYSTISTMNDVTGLTLKLSMIKGIIYLTVCRPPVREWNELGCLGVCWRWRGFLVMLHPAAVSW
jgi:hypothetical protein